MKKINTILMLLALALTPAFATKAQTTQGYGYGNPTCVNLSVILKIGSRDYYGRTNVRALQGYLYTVGYLRSTPTGYFGGQTLAALKQFQRDNGVYPTGTTNAQTRSKIKDLSCNPIVTPESKTINLQLKDYNQAWAPNSLIRFRWTATYIPTQLVVSVKDSYGSAILTKDIAEITSGESDVSLPSYLASGAYSLQITDQGANTPYSSNVITLQVNGGINPPNGGAKTIKILTPNGSATRDDVFQGGQQTTMTLQMSADKPYYIAYYLVPQSGVAVRTSNGTAFDASIGGYSLGSFQYNYGVANPSLYVTLPTDVYTGKYKLRVIMRDASNNVGVNVNTILAMDDSDYAFMLYTNYQEGAPASTPLTITAPNGGETIQAGGTFRIRATGPSDKLYSYSYYLTPQAGTPIKTGPGTYYDSVSGGYSLGGYSPLNIGGGGLDNTVAMPLDIPAGSYRIRLYLRNKNDTAGSPTAATAISYDDSNSSFTVTNQNGQTGTPTLKITSPNTTGVVWSFGQPYTISWTSTGLDSNTALVVSLKSSTGDVCQIGVVSAGAGQLTVTPAKGQRCTNSYSATTLQPGYYIAHITTQIQTMIYPSTAPVDVSDEYFQLKDDGGTLVTPTLSNFVTDYTYTGYNPTITIWGSGFNSSSKVIVAENNTVTPQYITPDGTMLTFKLPSTLVSQAGLYRVVVANYGQYGDSRLSNALNFRVWGFLN